MPPQFPVLCGTAARCSNTLAGTMFQVLWGTRSPVLAEPLVQGTTWNSVGGSTNDVTAANRYRGVVDISVPAFPAPVKAAKIESVITQAGALGDPFGSGLRTVWWVYGVGPVKVLFQHTSGEASFAQSAVDEPRSAAAPERREPAAARGWARSRRTAGATPST